MERRAVAAPPVEGWRKRGRPDECDASGEFSFLREMNGDLLEKILSRLPPSSFFRLRSVCKRWRSASTSATFVVSCTEVPRESPGSSWWTPTFATRSSLTVARATGRTLTGHLSSPSPSRGLRRGPGLLPLPLRLPLCLQPGRRRLPRAPSPIAGGRSSRPTNPRHRHEVLPSRPPVSILRSGPHLRRLCEPHRQGVQLGEIAVGGGFALPEEESPQEESEISSEETVYFLSKAGEVVSADIQRSPFKKYSSVITTVEAGEELIYFLGPTGAVVACNLSRREVANLPRLLPSTWSTPSTWWMAGAPRFSVDGAPLEFMSAFSFEPRVEARV
ncbi:unnamed protein product [Spirodela intermedia]|uniref:F-box domain-containing protein n=1 Tax=Spirodela intermedia TaxID=51605 RepID=A0A7I8J2I9_SPIIN|nr:unnamed protein product [Spirodela intermedia]CAA6664192.1 unnamed protein product [Spirodela intermedia]